MHLQLGRLQGKLENYHVEKVRWNFQVLWKLADCQERDVLKNLSYLLWKETLQVVLLSKADQGKPKQFYHLEEKILNVEKAEKAKILSSNEIGIMISALGTGIYDDFNIDKLRYHKIIIMTDADVDGSHIRTLILTFFYRHMEELVSAGHVYIAQPPLFKVKKGSSEVYLKDEDDLDDYLINQLVNDSVLLNDTGDSRTGNDLKSLILNAKLQFNAINALAKKIDVNLIERLAISGALSSSLLEDKEKASIVADFVSKALNKFAKPGEDGWSGDYNEANKEYNFKHDRRGVVSEYIIDSDMLNSSDARKLEKHATELQETYFNGAKLKNDDNVYDIGGPTDLYSKAIELGRKGLSIQRYKGLGEMNPDQLWETTLDPDARTILKVNIEDPTTAQEVFSTLMGDEVEPRRKFIQDRALEVENIDI